MGTVSEEPKQGHIYLQNDVSGEFDKVLATSKHSSVDTFLEHLMDLYTKASKSTQCVVVRTEVAQRYTALLCETRFQTSDDLMKHLLNLHVEYLKTASNNNTKETRERSVPRKSRKSQPKRNIKHTALLDSEDSGDHLTGSVTEDPWREVSVSSVEESETETSEVDLSRVKQEVIDVDDTNVKNSDKATIFKRIFHKNEEASTDLSNKVKAKKTCRNTNGVTRKSPVISSSQQVVPEIPVGNTESSPVSTPTKELSKKLVSSKRKTENEVENRKKKTDRKKKKKIDRKKKKEVKIEGDGDDLRLVPDYGSLFEETRVACVNIENVEEGHKYEFFTGDDTFSSLIAETNDSYQEIDEIRKIALDREQLRRSTKHFQNSNVRYNYDCFKCGKKFRNRAPLNLHIASEHNEDGGLGLLCNDCGKQVDYDHELELHKKFFCKKVKKTFQCISCKLSFITEFEKSEHPCTKDPTKPYYCSVQDCQTFSRNVKDLTEHVTRHLGIKPFLCNICGRAFSAKKDMDRHADIHKESKDYVCQICGQSFKSYHTMRRHVFAHKYKDRFKCDLCPYTTAMRNSFNQHMIKHKQRTHKCQICEKNLRSERSLSKHIQNRHTFNRIFTCRYCDFTTDVGLSYSSHMRSHRGLKHVDNSLETRQEMASDLSDQGQAGNGLESLSEDRDLQMTATKLQSAVTLTSTSLLVKCRSDAPMLADATMLGNEEVDISGQNADSIMANIVESSDANEISVIPREGTNANLVLYTMEVPASSLNVPSFISDTITTVSETENWNGGEVN
ncbi:zinc finger and BTB domain-containing protein 24-like isoform X2 [Mercenaria mercenaria]|uniref:zinc finger and BTB domain-containing protein 24-like isoform X2 n=1 Tax=Mercenaria mercenaria TaxID=6596 RepID=UPI00234F8BE6|nr:zinc finger and BTB domain-containing protein 24-like isoform X2 [Mercenaria mercenaria]